PFVIVGGGGLGEEGEGHQARAGAAGVGKPGYFARPAS
ncbi:hypothetical protein Pgy4_39845, partial [Pseudomonas savastanoi pv. glycinea str. race 4]